jgi:FkbM family methyltransferase
VPKRLSVRKRRELWRLTGYAINPVRRKARVIGRREQLHHVGDFEIRLPLPFYQRRDPAYDAYAIPLLRELADGVGSTVVIDVGANVGDTALAALSASRDIHVISVEGSPNFVRYLRDNLAPHADRATVVEGFVGPIGDRSSYVRTGTTGGFQGRADDGAAVVACVSLGAARPGDDFDQVIWKIDIDGFDIHVLAQHWDAIDAACDAIWFEFDPVGTLGDRADIDALIDQVSDSGRTLWIYDNLGRRMLTLPPGPGTRPALTSLASW